MEYEARKFAQRIVMIHLAILAVVIVVVIWAANVLYRSAREQAIDQAKQTQELLAKETALGIENYYESVTGVTNLLQPIADQKNADTTELNEQPGKPFLTPRPGATTQPRHRAVDSVTLARVNNGLGMALWYSIRDKASVLMLVDPQDDMNVMRVFGSADDAPAAKEIIAASREFLTNVRHRSMSPFLRFPTAKGGDAHLVAVPLRGSGGVLIVALVPMSRLEKEILESVNRSSSTGVMLIDETGTFISATQRAAVGHNINQLNDPRTRALAEKHNAEKFSGTLVFDTQEKLGDITFRRGMSTIAPISVLGQTWAVIVSSDLSEIENLIKPVFHNLILWAMFLGVAIAALLGSTAFQLIRSRTRLERMQREVLAKEVSDARKIQLQWLPKGNCRAEDIDIAALNRPATHISGDFYNWFQLDDGRHVVTIGDVTGHGMAAAFLMATTQLLVRAIMPRVLDPAECMRQINKQMLMQTFNGQFVTLLILVIDSANGRLEIATAGHQAPLVGKGGAFETLPLEPQFVLGVEADCDFVSQRYDLSLGESIVLYTDGATDVQRPDGERFTTDGLTKSLRGRFDSADHIIATLTSAVDHFRAGRDLGDDLTLVAIQLRSTMPAPKVPA